MKLLKKIIVLSVMAYLAISLNTGCKEETLISEIVPYSGEWKITFSYDNGNVFANSYLTILDTGVFCAKLKINGNNDSAYIKGQVTRSGDVTGKFAGSCSGTGSGNMEGTFTILMGTGYASGTFSDTLQKPNYKGTWEARRN